jgi:hypothetical protein
MLYFAAWTAVEFKFGSAEVFRPKEPPSPLPKGILMGAKAVGNPRQHDVIEWAPSVGHGFRFGCSIDLVWRTRFYDLSLLHNVDSVGPSHCISGVVRHQYYGRLCFALPGLEQLKQALLEESVHMAEWFVKQKHLRTA